MLLKLFAYIFNDVRKYLFLFDVILLLLVTCVYVLTLWTPLDKQSSLFIRKAGMTELED